ncbi:MAG: amidase [Alphaproteobacteria bacterium]|nr:amidase [Alphaproteobacteria bacterium]
MNDPLQWTLVEAADAVRHKHISAVELARLSIAAARAWQPSINAFIAIDEEAALRSAENADRDLARGQTAGLIHGVPLAHKDLFDRGGDRVTCGSKVLGDRHPTNKATCLERLDRAGAVTIGTLLMSELAMGAAGRNEHFGHCRNPWNAKRIAGGSSSGSGAAVGARTVYGSLGTDTGGSVRIPAALCGVTGLKPTQTRISRAGVMPLSYSLDNVGPVARTARDCARLMTVVAGWDERDPTSSHEPVPDYESRLSQTVVRGTRVGFPRQYFYDGIVPSVAKALDASLDVFRKLGAIVVEVDVPDQDELRELCNLILKVEAANIHSEWLRTRENAYSREVRTRLEAGLAIPGVRYLQAQRLRGEHLKTFAAEVFAKVDVLHTPGLAIEVPTLDDVDAAVSGDALSVNEQLARCTRTINYLGLPAIMVPCGFSANGMPVGFQMIGKPYGEARLLGLADAFQRETEFHRRSPSR